MLYRATGNEPFWAVDVTALDITLQRPDAEPMVFPYEPARDSAGRPVAQQITYVPTWRR